MPKIDTLIWDIGNVLIYWIPENVYQSDPRFSATDRKGWVNRVIKNPWGPGEMGWNAEMDKGTPFKESLLKRIDRFPMTFPDLAQKYPDYADLMRKYGHDFELSMADKVPGVDNLRRQFKRAGLRTLALSNFSSENWPRIAKLHPLMHDFEHMTVSGFVGMIKPDPNIFEHLIEESGLVPGQSVFIDDSDANIKTAQGLGFQTVLFTPSPNSPEKAVNQLMQDLYKIGLHLPT